MNINFNICFIIPYVGVEQKINNNRTEIVFNSKYIKIFLRIKNNTLFFKIIGIEYEERNDFESKKFIQEQQS